MRSRQLQLRLPLLAITALLAIAAFAAPAEAGTPSAIKAQNSPRLLNAHYLTIRGTIAGGRCRVSPPRLRLAPGQKAVEADEVSINYGRCATTWHVGTPARIRYAVPPRLGAVPAGLNSSSGYEYAWLTDIPGFTLTSDQSNISWAWNGSSCIAASSGSAGWYWDSNTFWGRPYNNGSWISKTCAYTDVWSQASFKNSNFCPLRTVTSSYSGVNVEGWYDGSLEGWVDSMSYSNSCLPLYLHSEVVRVTG